jgi:tetratricopeptide (TPR) repeat protein
VFTKSGYFSKKLFFKTNVPPEDVGIWNNKFAIELIPEIEGFNASLFNEPIGKFEFNSKIGDFDYDEVYTANMQKRIKALMREYEKAKREAFNKIIAQADDMFNKKEYDQAIEFYDKAIDLDPYDPYPDDQIYMIGKIIQKDQNAEKNYQKNIEIADKSFQSTDYIDAKKYYNRALKYKNEKYPNEQLALCDKFKDQPVDDSNNKAYNLALAAADKSYDAKQYPSALTKYTEASGFKPNEQYPKDKIAEINGILASLEGDQKAKEALEKAYKEAIALADAGFSSKNYSNARANYVKANEIKPAETYPRTRITEIDNLLAANKSLDEKYKGFIAVADQSFTAKTYESAKSNYQQALSIKPNESYPADRIKEIDALLLQLAQNQQKDLEASYQRAIAQADAAFNSKTYEEAKAAYNQALSLKRNEVYPKQKITEIDGILAELANKKRTYDLAIARADNSFNVEKWEAAKVDYQQALNVFPQEQYPQTRINEIENKLLALKNANDQKQAREKAYQEAIALADARFTENKYQESKNYYSQAGAVKPNETYPKQRIEEIDRIIAAEKALNERYNQIIATADTHFANQKWEDSKATFVNALQIKPNEAYPKQKIAEIDAKLADLLANKIERENKEKAYNEIILQADAQYTAKVWAQSKNLYQKALTVLPDELYPKQRITDIDNLLASVADKNRKYNEAIQNGDSKLAEKAYSDALAFYNQATTVKPDEAYPKTKIAEINLLLENQRKNQAAYENFIKLADAAFSAKQLEQAKSQYQSALQLKANEVYPQQRINEIDKLIAEQMRLNQAKDQLNAQYKLLITAADKAFIAKNYQDAKSNYTQASTVKPDEAYPKERLSDIESLMAAQMAQQQAYDAKLQEGESKLATKNYNAALAAYQQASQIKPNETFPKQKIDEISKLIDAENALKAKYDNLINMADAAFSSKQLEQAKNQYQQALGVKPNEQYPNQRIVEIDKLIAEQTKLLAEQERINTQYTAFISKADAGFNQKNYNEAKTNYTQAANLKPAETYPKQRLSEIDNILSTQLAQQKAYDEKMAEALSMFAAKNFNGALNAYQQASQLKPNESLPKQKITEIQGILADAAKKQQQYQQFISQADGFFNQNKLTEAKPVYQQALALMPAEVYPKNQITRIEQLQTEAAQKEASLQAQLKAYNEKIKEADQLFQAKSYDDAIMMYNAAKSVKANESYPDEQIAKINGLVKQAADKLDADFNNAIKQGDALKNQKKYEEAKQQYTLALNLKPNNPLPQAKLVELQNLIDKDRIAQQKQAQIDEEYNGFLSQADKAFRVDDYISAISLYKSAQTVKPAEKYPKEQIDICEQKIQEQKAMAAAEEDRRKKAELAASKESFGGNDFDYSGEERDQNFLSELSKKYPEGVTIENYDKKNKKIKRVIVNHSGVAKEYIEVTYSYGTYYFRNGQNISRSIFYSETKD